MAGFQPLVVSVAELLPRPPQLGEIVSWANKSAAPQRLVLEDVDAATVRDDNTRRTMQQEGASSSSNVFDNSITAFASAEISFLFFSLSGRASLTTTLEVDQRTITVHYRTRVLTHRDVLNLTTLTQGEHRRDGVDRVKRVVETAKKFRDEGSTHLVTGVTYGHYLSLKVTYFHIGSKVKLNVGSSGILGAPVGVVMEAIKNALLSAAGGGGLASVDNVDVSFESSNGTLTTELNAAAKSSGKKGLDKLLLALATLSDAAEDPRLKEPGTAVMEATYLPLAAVQPPPQPDPSDTPSGSEAPIAVPNVDPVDAAHKDISIANAERLRFEAEQLHERLGELLASNHVQLAADALPSHRLGTPHGWTEQVRWMQTWAASVVEDIVRLGKHLVLLPASADAFKPDVLAFVVKKKKKKPDGADSGEPQDEPLIARCVRGLRDDVAAIRAEVRLVEAELVSFNSTRYALAQRGIAYADGVDERDTYQAKSTTDGIFVVADTPLVSLDLAAGATTLRRFDVTKTTTRKSPFDALFDPSDDATSSSSADDAEIQQASFAAHLANNVRKVTVPRDAFSVVMAELTAPSLLPDTADGGLNVVVSDPLGRADLFDGDAADATSVTPTVRYYCRGVELTKAALDARPGRTVGADVAKVVTHVDVLWWPDHHRNVPPAAADADIIDASCQHAEQQDGNGVVPFLAVRRQPAALAPAAVTGVALVHAGKVSAKPPKPDGAASGGIPPETTRTFTVAALYPNLVQGCVDAVNDAISDKDSLPVVGLQVQRQRDSDFVVTNVEVVRPDEAAASADKALANSDTTQYVGPLNRHCKAKAVYLKLTRVPRAAASPPADGSPALPDRCPSLLPGAAMLVVDRPDGSKTSVLGHQATSVLPHELGTGWFNARSLAWHFVPDHNVPYAYAIVSRGDDIDDAVAWTIESVPPAKNLEVLGVPEYRLVVAPVDEAVGIDELPSSFPPQQLFVPVSAGTRDGNAFVFRPLDAPLRYAVAVDTAAQSVRLVEAAGVGYSLPKETVAALRCVHVAPDDAL